MAAQTPQTTGDFTNKQFSEQEVANKVIEQYSEAHGRGSRVPMDLIKLSDGLLGPRLPKLPVSSYLKLGAFVSTLSAVRALGQHC